MEAHIQLIQLMQEPKQPLECVLQGALKANVAHRTTSATDLQNKNLSHGHPADAARGLQLANLLILWQVSGCS